MRRCARRSRSDSSGLRPGPFRQTLQGSERIIADCAAHLCADKQNEGAMGVATIAAAA